MITDKILIAGYWTPGIRGIETLFAQGRMPQDIGLLTHDDERNQALIAWAKANGIETQTFSVKSDACYQWIHSQGYRYLISLYFRHIVPKRVLDLFPGRAMNLHAGLLPQYRGCWSSPWAIINGERFSGYTYHYMTPEIDEGMVILQDNVAINPADTAYSLYHHVMSRAMDMFPDALLRLQRSFYTGPQIGEGHYYNRALPYGGYIDPAWHESRIERFIRAMIFPPFKGAMLKLPNGEDVEIRSIEQYREVIVNA